MLALVKEMTEKASFEEFWMLYPRRVAKKDAEKAFRRIRWTQELWGEVKAALENWTRSEQWQKDGGAFIPHASTWLRGERWTDEIEVAIEISICRWRGCHKPGTKSLGDYEFCETHFHARKRGESPV